LKTAHKQILRPLSTVKGYSLLEMMVVLAIIGVLIAVAVPNFLVWNQKHKLKSDVANLAGTLAFARMTAINQNTPVVVNVSQVLPAAVTVTFTNPLGAAMPGLPTIIMDGVVRLTDGAGAAGVSPQALRFTNMGTKGLEVNANNICIPGACSSDPQVLNFRNAGTDNYRIVVLQTGRIIWCYIPTCTQ
jgi:prepilin-type N-terminal cleavage/methylation domain-containing protein